MNIPFIGIDFGTSKSAMAWFDHRTQRAEIIRNADGEETTPSVVYLGKQADAILVGKLAERKLQEDDQAEHNRFVLSVKRDLLSAPNKVLDGRLYTPVTVATMILQKLKKDAEELHFYQPVRHVVITYPASFETLQQDKIKEAAIGAGFSEVVLLPEPIAAALAYGQTGLQVGNHILIYDFGGGTFDVAVLSRLSNGSFTSSLQPRGLADCGGDDLDRELYDYCNEIARQTLQRPIHYGELRDRRFLLYCRDRKENLSYTHESTFSTYLFEDNHPIAFRHLLKRSIFENRIKKHLERTVTLTKDVVQEAKNNRVEVDTVALIGGSSKVPLITQLLGDTLPIAPRPWQQSSFAVALGAAYYAQSLWGERSVSHTPPFSTLEPLEPPTPASPPPPGNPQEEYRFAVRTAWMNRASSANLSREQVNKLDALVQTLGLMPATASSIESEIMGMPRERTLEPVYQKSRDEYRTRLRQMAAGKRLTRTGVASLTSYAQSISLNNIETAMIEIELLGNPKEAILAHGGHVVVQPLPKSLQLTKRWRFTGDKVFSILLLLIGFGVVGAGSGSGGGSALIVGAVMLIIGIIWFLSKSAVR